ncbi:hypothetical protein [Phaeobacter sp. HF9A]|uniref:hypothetical protein n=1 Tax=Phaeobacter sp. HF9A TaxID=2721561 RepID=UPI00143186A7|nr:hypothetical protein [Phaeobacter sp. HF9A]NIZ12597.1 hypothetical protein [Phaeobacter sp. HF9A]
MTLFLSRDSLLADVFETLEQVDPNWLDQQDYWEDYNARFFQSNGLTYSRSEDSNVTTWLTAPDRASFAAMSDVLLEQLQARCNLGDIDLVLLAHWTPDLHLGSSVTNFALHKLGLVDGFGFAISDRGLSAPFYALDCAERMLRDTRKKALVMVMDQKHLLYRSPSIARLEPQNAACVMVLERDGIGEFAYAGYQTRRGLHASDLPGLVAARCDELGIARGDTTVIAAPAHCAALAAGGPVLAQDPSRMCSAPFAALAQDGLARHALLLSQEEDRVTTVAFRRREDLS